ncbi:hypothetical protein M885DRAFT_618308 [Pelagophyceae sp. CCMP2097]|nr:hypothetical protein M885DRAFT_618308 [Pelagophyceae sp. CCMP2097]
MGPAAAPRSPRSAAAAPRSLLSAAAAPWSPEGPLAQTSARNLPFDTTEDDVRQAFEHVCWVEHVKMPVDHETGLSHGLAFVTLEKEANEADGQF